MANIVYVDSDGIQKVAKTGCIRIELINVSTIQGENFFKDRNLKNENHSKIFLASGLGKSVEI